MSFHRICDLDELTIDQGKEFLIEGKVIAVFRRADDQVFAIDGMCAHQGGPIAQGLLSGNCITCPWHGWQYDISSGTNLLTQKKMLACFPTQVRDGAVWIDAS